MASQYFSNSKCILYKEKRPWTQIMCLAKWNWLPFQIARNLSLRVFGKSWGRHRKNYRSLFSKYFWPTSVNTWDELNHYVWEQPYLLRFLKEFPLDFRFVLCTRFSRFPPSFNFSAISRCFLFHFENNRASASLQPRHIWISAL
jgi:hypothetical protein